MAKAMKCDACGKFFDIDKSCHQRVMFLKNNDIYDAYEDTYDLCDDCMDAVKRIIFPNVKEKEK